MNKKEKSAWGVFSTSVALPLVFVGFLSFQGCGCHLDDSGGSPQDSGGGPRQDEICLEEDDCFRSPEALSVVSAPAGAQWIEAWNFIPEGAHYLKPEHDRIIEQLEKNTPSKSALDRFQRSVPLLYAAFVKNGGGGGGSKFLSNIAVAGISIQEGVFRSASKEDENEYERIGFGFSNTKKAPQEYKKYRIMQSDVFIEKFPAISFWFRTEKEKDLVLKGEQLAPGYGFFGVPVFLKKSELLGINSTEKYDIAMKNVLKDHDLEFVPGDKIHPYAIQKIGDVPPKEGSNLKELWLYSFHVGDKNKKTQMPLALSSYLVKIHVG